jgi:hypothetical protein
MGEPKARGWERKGRSSEVTPVILLSLGCWLQDPAWRLQAWELGCWVGAQALAMRL